MATLTFAYADSTAVVGPLAAAAEPHTYDLCAEHAANLTAPKGWDIVRPTGGFSSPEPGPDDLEALANAVREVGLDEPDEDPPDDEAVGRRGHLRVLHFPGTDR